MCLSVNAAAAATAVPRRPRAFKELGRLKVLQKTPSCRSSLPQKERPFLHLLEAPSIPLFKHFATTTTTAASTTSTTVLPPLPLPLPDLRDMNVNNSLQTVQKMEVATTITMTVHRLWYGCSWPACQSSPLSKSTLLSSLHQFGT